MNSEISKNSLKQYNSFRRNIFHSKSDFPLFIPTLSHTNRSNFGKNTLGKLVNHYLHQQSLSIEKISVKSTYHVLYKVITEDNQYVLKISKLNLHLSDFTLIIESKIQDIVKNISISKVYHVDISRKEYPFDFLLMEYIAGHNLESSKEKKNIYFQMGNLFKKIHKTKVKNYGDFNISMLMKNELVGRYKTWSEYIRKNLETHISIANKLGLYNDIDKKLINKIFYFNKNAFSDSPAVLLHNDPSLRNIMCDENKHLKIIDWEDAIGGDYLWDIAFIDTFLSQENDRMKFQEFCQGYGLSIAELYNNKKYWVYYLRISLLKVVSKYYLGRYNKDLFHIDKNRIETAMVFLRN